MDHGELQDTGTFWEDHTDQGGTGTSMDHIHFDYSSVNSESESDPDSEPDASSDASLPAALPPSVLATLRAPAQPPLGTVDKQHHVQQGQRKIRQTLGRTTSQGIEHTSHAVARMSPLLRPRRATYPIH